jgi:small GTP-binding protein
VNQVKTVNLGVGKSCLLYRFSDNKFREDLSTTLGVEFRKRLLNIKGNNVDVQVWDTAG